MQVQELEALLLSSQRPHEAFDRIAASDGPAQRSQLDDAWLGAHSALVSKMDSSEVHAALAQGRPCSASTHGCQPGAGVHRDCAAATYSAWAGG